jgi:hypothetical protein
MTGPWREPAEETEGYPGFWVCDNGVGGALTIGRSRLSVEAVIWSLVEGGWQGVLAGWPYIEDTYGVTGDDMARFLAHLLHVPGEFARLLLVLADAERCEQASNQRKPWWHVKRHRKRVGDQLRRCLAVLEGAR